MNGLLEGKKEVVDKPHNVVLLYVQSQLHFPGLRLSFTDAKQVATFTTTEENVATAKTSLQDLAAGEITQSTVGRNGIQLSLTVHPRQSVKFEDLLKRLQPIFTTTHQEYVYSSQPPNPRRIELVIRTRVGRFRQIALKVKRSGVPLSMEALRPFMQVVEGLGLVFEGANVDGWYLFQASRQLPATFRNKIVTKYAQFDSGLYRQ